MCPIALHSSEQVLLAYNKLRNFKGALVKLYFIFLRENPKNTCEKFRISKFANIAKWLMSSKAKNNV